jgi:hypothetical protein
VELAKKVKRRQDQSLMIKLANFARADLIRKAQPALVIE